MDVPQELLVAQVPNLILQPMVENAVKHSIAKARSGWNHSYPRLGALNAMLTLSIFNDGPSLTADWETTWFRHWHLECAHAALKSLRRLKFDLRLQNQDNGVEVSVSVPFREA